MNDNPLQVIADELRPILNRVRQAKETLGMGGLDCAYLANKQLEPVLFRLSELVEELSKETMKLNGWSVLKTADAKGLAIKPPSGGAHHYEICIASRDGWMEINVYVDGVVLPAMKVTLPEKWD